MNTTKISLTKLDALAIAIILVPTFWIFGQLTHFMATNSLWNDELYSIWRFSSQGWYTALTDYHVPNNHIFFNFINALLPWSDSVEPIRARAVSFFSMLLTLGLLLRYFYRKEMLVLGTVCCFLLFSNQELIKLSLQARGYGLICLCATLLIIVTERFFKDRLTSDLILISSLIVIGVWTLPTFVFFAGSLLFITFLITRDIRVLAAGILVVAAIVLTYLPVYVELLESATTYAGIWGTDYDSYTAVFKTFSTYAFSELGLYFIYFALISITIVPIFLAYKSRLQNSSHNFLLTASAAIWAFFTACLVMETPALRTTSFIVFPILMLLALCVLKVVPQIPSAARVLSLTMLAIVILYFGMQRNGQLSFVPIENWREMADVVSRSFPAKTRVFANYRKHFLQQHIDNRELDGDFDESRFTRGEQVFIDTNFRNHHQRFRGSDFSEIVASFRIAQVRGGFQEISFTPSPFDSIESLRVNEESLDVGLVTDRNKNTHIELGGGSLVAGKPDQLELLLDSSNTYKSLVLVGKQMQKLCKVWAVGKSGRKIQSKVYHSDNTCLVLLEDGVSHLSFAILGKNDDLDITVEEIWGYHAAN